MKFVIRDDDLNYFSKLECIEKWYGDIFRQEIPVGLAAVPFVIPLKKSLYPEFEKVDLKEYSIHENKELIEYIKNNKSIEILQHGYNHELSGRQYEYGAGAKLEELIKKTLKGKKELEYSFNCNILVFVPPHDRILNNGVKAIEIAGLNIIRGKGSKNFMIRKKYIFIVSKMVLHWLKHFLAEYLPAYPYVLNFGKHKEAYSYRLSNNNLKELYMGLGYVKRKNGNFIITAHLHSFNQKKKDNLTKIIAKAREMGFKFIKPSDLFKEE